MASGVKCLTTSYPHSSVGDNGDEEERLEFELVRDWAKLSVESIACRCERYVEYFAPSTQQLRIMAESFEHELELGLEMHRRNPHRWIPAECSFKMLDSCVTRLPSGKEEGVYYALDFGGTNFRVVRARLKGNGTVHISQFKQSLSNAQSTAGLAKGLLDSRATATKMFDFFAHACKELMAQEGDKGGSKAEGASPPNVLRAGFTFSFPCNQRQLSSAVLMEWTKGFETGRKTNDPVEGLDVAMLMNNAFERCDVPLEINAVLNDTVGTLLAGAYAADRAKNPPCLIGLILGTGMNACYYERESAEYGYHGKIINIECGNFNRDLTLTNVDHELDFAEVSNRGRQRFEKMVSGAYLGEIARRAIVKVLQHLAPAAAWQPFSFSTEAVSRIVGDVSADLSTTVTVLSHVWQHTFAPELVQIVHRLCSAVMNRAAALAAVLIAGTARKTRHLQPAMGGCSVAIDGSLYKMVPFFQRQTKVHLETILGKSTADLVHVIMADDGSGKGAAILAATCCTPERDDLLEAIPL